jgi:hypothetical protein
MRVLHSRRRKKEKKNLHLLIGSLLKMRRKTCKQPSD